MTVRRTASIIAGMAPRRAPRARVVERIVCIVPRSVSLAVNGTGLNGAIGTRTGVDGIRIVAANSVFVEDTVIGEFTQSGVKVATANESVNLTLDNVTIRNINTNGVSMTTTKGQVVLRSTMSVSTERRSRSRHSASSAPWSTMWCRSTTRPASRPPGPTT